MSFNKSRQSGYLIASFSSLIGAFMFAYLGTYLGINYVNIFMSNADLEGIIPPLLGLFIGWCLGGIMGCWVALRWRCYPNAKTTAIILATIAPLEILLWIVLYQTISDLFRGEMNNLEFSDINNKIKLITASLIKIFSTLLARFLTENDN